MTHIHVVLLWTHQWTHHEWEDVDSFHCPCWVGWEFDPIIWIVSPMHVVIFAV